MKKPSTTKRTTALEIFTIEEPLELIEFKDTNGKTKKRWRTAQFHFTTADSPVTFNGIQYIPLSSFDQVRWNSKIEELKEGT